MKTFGKYLTSYICTLLLPIVILSVVVLQIILNYCGNQLVQGKETSLQQLNTYILMQTQQLDAYNLQTTQMSSFSQRKLNSQYSAFFAVEHVLGAWQMTNPFTDMICYYNTSSNRIYSYNAVYSMANFNLFRMKEFNIDQDAMEQLLSGTNTHTWLSLPNAFSADGNSALVYITSVRSTANTRNKLICFISIDTLQELIHSAIDDTACSTYVMNMDGDVLFASQPQYSYLHAHLSEIQNLDTTTGHTTLGGTNVLYAQTASVENGLRYITIIPTQIAYQPIYQLWVLYSIGMVLVFLLGGIVIALVMQLNYQPLSKVSSYASASLGVTNSNGDKLGNLHTALQKLFMDNTSITGLSRAMKKEQLILKLLIGSYHTLADFNRDGAALELQLKGDVWRVLTLQLNNVFHDDEVLTRNVILYTVMLLRKTCEPLYIEIPENKSILFVVDRDALSQSDLPDFLDLIRQQLGYMDLQIKACLSKSCNSLTSLAACYSTMVYNSCASADTASFVAYPQELYDALRNAIEFRESERVHLLLRSMAEAIREDQTREERCALLYELLYQIRQPLKPQQDAIILQHLRTDFATALFSPEAGTALWAREILTHLGVSLERWLTSGEQVKAKYSGDILDFLNLTALDTDFSVNQVARHFHLSISNLSHYFKSHVGKSMSEWVENKRIQTAMQLLRSGGASIAEISLFVGYEQPASFMRAFKKVTGQTPSQFRKKQAQELKSNS